MSDMGQFLKKDKREKSLPNFSDHEWLMFLDCPENEIPYCYVYEYAREKHEICYWVNEFRNHSNDAAYWENVCKGKTLLQMPNFFFRDSYGKFLKECCINKLFPEKPWLEITQEIRNSLLENHVWKPVELPYGRSHSTGNATLKKQVIPIQCEPLPTISDVICFPEEKKPLGVQLAVQKLAEFKSNYSHAIFINWHESDQALAKRFQLWLSYHRPTKSRFGRLSYKEKLHELAAYRLRRNGKYKNIEDLLSDTEEVIGRRLYADAGTFSKSAGRAAKHIENFGSFGF